MGWNTLIIKTLKVNKKLIVGAILLLVAIASITIYYTFANSENTENDTKKRKQNLHERVVASWYREK